MTAGWKERYAGWETHWSRSNRIQSVAAVRMATHSSGGSEWVTEWTSALLVAEWTSGGVCCADCHAVFRDIRVHMLIVPWGEQRWRQQREILHSQHCSGSSRRCGARRHCGCGCFERPQSVRGGRRYATQQSRTDRPHGSATQRQPLYKSWSKVVDTSD